jgi:hypothetical protein
MPGGVFDALSEAADWLRARARLDAIEAATFQDLCNSAYGGDSPNHKDMLRVMDITNAINRELSGKSDEEIEWEQFERFKRHPNVRFTPKPGVGNG